MGTIKDFGKKAVEATKGAAEWASYHIWDAIQLAGCFFTGYGIAAFVSDVTGRTDSINNGIRREGFIKGYDNGFRDGQTSAAELISVANSVSSPNPIKK